jgi:hypothetical protein
MEPEPQVAVSFPGSKTTEARFDEPGLRLASKLLDDPLQFSTVSVAEPTRSRDETDRELEGPKSTTEFPVTVRLASVCDVPFRFRVPPEASVRLVYDGSWLLVSKTRLPEPETVTEEPRASPDELLRTTVPPVMLVVPV